MITPTWGNPIPAEYKAGESLPRYFRAEEPLSEPVVPWDTVEMVSNRENVETGCSTVWYPMKGFL